MLEADGVKSADRVIDIFEYFAARKEVASLAQISAQLPIPKSSCLKLLGTLEGRGYLYRLGEEPKYYPSSRWLTQAEIITAHDPVRERVRPAMAALCKTLDETVILANLSGKRVQYLDVVETSRVIRFVAVAGETKPIHPAASGRALLGLMSEAARGKFVQSLPFDKFTRQTTPSRKHLLAAVADGVARGWHFSIGEYQDDIVSIAAAVRLGGGNFALVVGAPRHRAEREIDRIGEALKAAAHDIESSEN